MAVIDEQPVNALIESVHTPRIERPDMLKPRGTTFSTQKMARKAKRDWHPVAAGMAKISSLLCLYGHSWNKGEKILYRRAIQSVKHPCCPTCGKPMNENVITTLDGLTRKSWFCERDQNL